MGNKVKFKPLYTIGLLIFLLVCLVAGVMASPPLPYTIYGSVSVNGSPAPVSSVITALDPDNVTCATFTITQEGLYGFMHIAGDDPETESDEGAVSGDTITFFLNGIQADENVSWQSGTSENINLTFGLADNESQPNCSLELNATTDESTYYPNETALISGYLVNGTCNPLTNTSLNISILFNESPVNDTEVFTDENGYFSIEYALVNYSEGNYTVKAQYSELEAFAYFSVRPEPECFSNITVNTDSPAYLVGQTVSISGEINDTCNPVENLSVNISILFNETSVFDTAVTTDEEGSFVLEYNITNESNPSEGEGNYTVKAQYEDLEALAYFMLTSCVDADNDTFYAENPYYDCGPADCNDSDPTTYPNASEIYDGIDNDCDNLTDEDLNCTLSLNVGTDASAYILGEIVLIEGLLVNGTCNALSNETVNISVIFNESTLFESQASTDEEGNFEVEYNLTLTHAEGSNQSNQSFSEGNYTVKAQYNESEALAYFMLTSCVDADNDTFYAENPYYDCGPVDCNDSDPHIYPGAVERCNNLDDDCNGELENYTSFGTISCGKGACERTVRVCVAGEIQQCIPGDPFPEVCDSVDNDCNGLVDDGLVCKSSGGGGGSIPLRKCEEKWGCTPWSECVDGFQNRTCKDLNKCGTVDERPALSRPCRTPGGGGCTPEWECTEFTECMDGVRLRECTDMNECGTLEGKPEELEECEPTAPTEPGCKPQWVCTPYSDCANGTQSRTCLDMNNCNLTEDKPSELRNCTVGTPNTKGPTGSIIFDYSFIADIILACILVFYLLFRVFGLIKIKL